MPFLAVRKPLSKEKRSLVAILSFAIPLMIWSAVSYLPFVWHPLIKVTDAGSVDYFKANMLVPRETFEFEAEKSVSAGLDPPSGLPANPLYLPAPHEVGKALYTAFATEPRRQSEKWLHESLWSSIQVIFWGFILSSMLGIPIGILAGTFDFFSKL